MKYNVGDKVRIKSLDWYHHNKDGAFGGVCIGDKKPKFIYAMSKYCGMVLTIDDHTEYDGEYYMVEDNGVYVWADEMFEGLAEDETKSNIIEEAKTYWDGIKDAWICPEGFEFSDENGNVINATKISLRKKKEVIPDLHLDSIRTVREYCTEHSRIWLETYKDNPNVCVFTHLWVDEDHRRKGYGSKALEQAEIIAKDLGRNTVHLKVETYSWMSKWYLRSGYKFLTNAEDNYTWLTKSI